MVCYYSITAPRGAKWHTGNFETWMSLVEFSLPLHHMLSFCRMDLEQLPYLKLHFYLDVISAAKT